MPSFPCRSLLLLPSPSPLFHSPAPSLLLCLSLSSAFISLYFPWYLIQWRHSGYSFYSLASPVLYTFLSPLFLTPLSSLSYPLHAHSSFPLITHQSLFLPWHTLSSQMKETLSDCLVFQEYDPSQGHIVCLCLRKFFFPPALAWNIEDEKM